MNLLKYRDIDLFTNAGGGRIGGRIKLRKGKTIGGVVDVSTGQIIPGTGTEVVTGEMDFFPNIVTNTGLDAIADSPAYLETAYCHCGTGTTTETASDTALVTHVNYTSTIQDSSQSAQASAPYYGVSTRTFRFAQGDAEGVIAEIGFAPGTANTDMFSRARVKTVGGTPTTITVLSDEWLDVTYELRMYPDHILANGNTDDGTGSITYDSTSYNYTIRPCYVNNPSYISAYYAEANYKLVSGSVGFAYGSDATIGGVTSVPSATSQVALQTVTLSKETYSSSSYERDVTMTLGLNDGNATGGIKAWTFFTPMGSYQVVLDSAVPKDNTKTMTIVNNIAWTRATIT